MKQSIYPVINPGAYGWCHEHWTDTFYPEGLPAGRPEDDAEDWRLAYYSNQFNAVLVPADYWYTGGVADCENWLDDVHENFQFFVECRPDMLSYISLDELTEHLKKLQPQLSAVVFLSDRQTRSDSGLQSAAELLTNQFDELLDALQLSIFTPGLFIDSAMGSQAINVCWPDMQADQERKAERPFPASFVFIENDLSDLRQIRTMVENYVMQAGNTRQQAEKNVKESTIIVNHPQLQAADLSRFRAMLEIMGR